MIHERRLFLEIKDLQDERRKLVKEKKLAKVKTKIDDRIKKIDEQINEIERSLMP